ncbi:MAG: hypothetical protein ACI9IN_002053, partial [Porticoccaceae bacterium]
TTNKAGMAILLPVIMSGRKGFVTNHESNTNYVGCAGGL